MLYYYKDIFDRVWRLVVGERFTIVCSSDYCFDKYSALLYLLPTYYAHDAQH